MNTKPKTINILKLIHLVIENDFVLKDLPVNKIVLSFKVTFKESLFDDMADNSNIVYLFLFLAQCNIDRPKIRFK